MQRESLKYYTIQDRRAGGEEKKGEDGEREKMRPPPLRAKEEVLYSCDFSEKMNQSPSSNLLAKVQNIIRRCRKNEQEESAMGVASTTEGGVMSCQSHDAPITPCNCKNSGSSLIGGSGAGWEGTALLHHGSHVKLGCLQFIFSITEFANKPLKEELTTCSLTPTPGQQGEQLSKAAPPPLQPNLVT